MFAPIPVVFVDANVWFNRTLRDWVGVTYIQGDQPAFEERWSEDVLAELVHHLRKVHPDWEGGRIAAIREHIEQTFENGRVRDFTTATYTGSDAGDAHVHGAAEACGATILLTSNVGDFPQAPYDTLTPDEFFTLLDDAAPDVVAAATFQMVEYWMRTTKSADLPAMLRKAECHEFAARVRRHLISLQDRITRL